MWRGSRYPRDAIARAPLYLRNSIVISSRTSGGAGAQECFVYLVLPGQTDFVTVGRFRVETDRHGITTGRFVYGKSYLDRRNALPVDPIELKLSSRTYETRLLNGIFGALRD